MSFARGTALVALATLAVWPNAAKAEIDFSSTIDGIELRPEIGTGLYGYELTGNLGWMWIGLRDYDRRWLFTWNGEAEAVFGGVAYEHPYDVIYGVHALAQAEGGLRLRPRSGLSPYASVGVDAQLAAITQSGVSPNAGTSINNLDALAGFFGMADLRPGFGISYLGRRHSLVAEAQLLDEVDSPQTNQPGLVYLGGGLHARYDRPNNLTAIGDISYAVTPANGEAALGTTTYTGRWAMSLSAVKKAHRFFAGIGVAVSRAGSQVSYAGGPTYTTAAPVDSRIWLLVGYRP